MDQFEAITSEKLKEIDEKYKEIKYWTACDVFYLNVDDEDLEREMGDIIEYLRNEGDALKIGISYWGFCEKFDSCDMWPRLRTVTVTVDPYWLMSYWYKGT